MNLHLSVVDGTSDQSVYNYNEVAIVTPNEAPLNQAFSHWEVAGKRVSFDESYTFTMLEDKTVTALFKETVEQEEPLISMSNKLELRTGKDSYLVQMYVPENYTLIDYGMLSSVTPMFVSEMNLNNSSVVKRQASSYFGITKEFLVTYNTTQSDVRAYMVLEDESQNLHHIYSEVTILDTRLSVKQDVGIENKIGFGYELLRFDYNTNAYVEVKAWTEYLGSNIGPDYWYLDVSYEEGMRIVWKPYQRNHANTWRSWLSGMNRFVYIGEDYHIEEPNWDAWYER